LDRLHGTIEHHVNRALQTDLWQTLSAPQTDARTVASILKYLMLESFSYGPHAVRSMIRAVSRFPVTNYALSREAAHTIIEEVPHAELALRDFVALGGDEQWARSRRMTPEAFSLASVAQMLCDNESPFAYLGFLYFFESLTRELAPRAKAILELKGIGQRTRRFVDVHAVDDIEHVQEVAELIQKVVSSYPDAESAIEYGMEVTATVYPYPLWQSIMRRVRSESDSAVLG
jgi:pyrroloquinoline quinone (PQQ) biosynthesis protein C